MTETPTETPTVTGTEPGAKGNLAAESRPRAPLGAARDRLLAALGALLYAVLGLLLVELFAYDETPAVESVVLEEDGGDAIHIGWREGRRGGSLQVVLARLPIEVDFRFGRIHIAGREIVVPTTAGVFGVGADGIVEVFAPLRPRHLPPLDRGFEPVRLALEAHDPAIRAFWARP